MHPNTEQNILTAQAKAVDEQPKNTKEFIETLIHNLNDSFSVIDAKNFKIILVNRAFLNAHNIEEREVIGRPCYEISHHRSMPCEPPEHTCPLSETLRTGDPSSAVHIHYDKEGRKKYFEIKTSPIRDEKGEIHQVIHISHDITEYKKAVEALWESEDRYKRLISSVTDYIYTVTVQDGRPVATSHGPGCVAVTGYTSEEYGADPFLWYRMVYEEDRQAVLKQAEHALTGTNVTPLEHRIIHKDGTIRWVRNTPVVRKNEKEEVISYDGLISDITERKQLETHFLQAQKMETVGRLAGGVAHDFNNHLTVITGHCDLALLELHEKDPFRSHLEEIKRAADRAANLTRQLLAFSRRQVIQPKVINLKNLILNIDKMLRRIIGEDIELLTLLKTDLESVEVDPGQFEQILVNLAVNARDAMPKGGKLLIETANVELDEVYARNHVSVTPGRYVMFSMSDTGMGMTAEVRERIFEPFFTTKEKGKGTGLGLSMVYGIVKQSKGNIWVYSEPGKGTAFKIYLPWVDMPLEEVKEKRIEKELHRGSETVLVVEDQEEVRRVAVEILRRQGYNVLEASQGDEALLICEQHERPIHLMVTDVVMPRMSGPELAGRLALLYPEMKVLYMSGYTENAIVHHGVLDEGVNYIQKPFEMHGLGRMVQEVLNK